MMIDSGWSIRFSPTPGRSCDDVDAELLEVLARADARVQQQPRRVDRAARDDDLLAGRDRGRGRRSRAAPRTAVGAAARRLDAHRARLGLDRQVRPAPCTGCRYMTRRRRAHAGRGVVADVEEAGPVAVRARVPVGVLRARRAPSRRPRSSRTGSRCGRPRRPARAGPGCGRSTGPSRRSTSPRSPGRPSRSSRPGNGLNQIIVLCDEQPPSTFAREWTMCALPRGCSVVRVREVERPLEQPEPAADLQHVVVADVGRAPLEHADATRSDPR